MSYVGPNTLKHFVQKYFGNPKNITGLGDGTVTGAIKALLTRVTGAESSIKTLNDSLTEINERPKILLVPLPDIEVTTGANELVRRSIISKADMDRITPSGYRYISTLITDAGYADQWQVTASLYGGDLYVQIQSGYGASLTATITGFIVFADI